MDGTRTGPAAPARPRQAVVTAAAVICGLSMLGLGIWAFLDPPSFSDFVDFAPYNQHLIHDAGALLALWWSDALMVALTGFAVASGLHTLSHAIDRSLGGHDSDVPSLGLLTVVALIALYLHGRKP